MVWLKEISVFQSALNIINSNKGFKSQMLKSLKCTEANVRLSSPPQPALASLPDSGSRKELNKDRGGFVD